MSTKRILGAVGVLMFMSVVCVEYDEKKLNFDNDITKDIRSPSVFVVKIQDSRNKTRKVFLPRDPENPKDKREHDVNLYSLGELESLAKTKNMKVKFYKDNFHKYGLAVIYKDEKPDEEKGKLELEKYENNVPDPIGSSPVEYITDSDIEKEKDKLSMLSKLNPFNSPKSTEKV